MPPNWSTLSSMQQIVFCKLEHEGSSQTGASVAKSVTITEDLIWSLHIHGQKLNASKCKALSYVRDKVPTKTAMSQLLAKIGNLSVFPENLNCHFLALADSHKGSFHYHSKAQQLLLIRTYLLSLRKKYKRTLRCKECELFNRCDVCKQYCNLCIFSQQKLIHKHTVISSHTNIPLLTST